MKNAPIREQNPTTPVSHLAIATTIATLAAILAFAPVAGAATVDVQIDATCIQGCVIDLRTCLTDAHQAIVDCAIQDGCVALAASARTACAAGPGTSLCIEARAEYRNCIQPCRAELRSDTRACQNASLHCLHDDCGLIDLPPQCGRAAVSVTAGQ